MRDGQSRDDAEAVVRVRHYETAVSKSMDEANGLRKRKSLLLDLNLGTLFALGGELLDVCP